MKNSGANQYFIQRNVMLDIHTLYSESPFTLIYLLTDMFHNRIQEISMKEIHTQCSAIHIRTLFNC